MSYQSRPQAAHSRLPDLLEAIKQEFESVLLEASVYRMHKDEFDVKYSQQLAELNQIRQTVFELEMSHRKMKEQYEEEILRLKLELEARDRLQQLAALKQQPPQQSYYPPPVQATTPQTAQLPPPQLHLQQLPAAVAAPLPAPRIEQVKQEPSTAVVAAPATPSAVAAAPAQQLPQLNGYSLALRAVRKKQIPAFLEELDVNNVAEHLRKVRDDYYVVYNPAFVSAAAKPLLDVELVHTLSHLLVVCCVRFSKDGKQLATGCNKLTQVYSVDSGQLLHRLVDELLAAGATAGDAAAPLQATSDLYIRLVCFLPDGKFLATGAEDKIIRIWDLSTQQVVKRLRGHEQDIYSLDFFPDGQRLVSGSGDKTVRVWDCALGQCSFTLLIEDGVTTVAVSPDGHYIAAGLLDWTVRVWDASTGFLVERLDLEVEHDNGHTDSVYLVAFTSNGREIVSGSLDKTCKLWLLKTAPGRAVGAPAVGSSTGSGCEVTYVGHKDFVLSVCATPNGDYILLGSKDRGMIMWDKRSGDPLLMLQGHRNSVISVSVGGSDGQTGLFATGSGDCSAKIWRWTKA